MTNLFEPMATDELIENVPALSGGFVAAVFQGKKVVHPVLQILNFKSIANNRYRLILSDGIHSMATAILASQLSYMVDNREIALHCVCCLRNYTIGKMKDGRTVLNIMELEVLQLSATQFGSPQDYVATTVVSAQNNDPATTTPATLPVRQGECPMLLWTNACMTTFGRALKFHVESPICLLYNRSVCDL
uniref:replication protein A 70 kDa DNA-binding subunit-like n=1 Tax=Myxine glutinosa TaxID=7769 RepID=UPI00358F078F